MRPNTYCSKRRRSASLLCLRPRRRPSPKEGLLTTALAITAKIDVRRAAKLLLCSVTGRILFLWPTTSSSVVAVESAPWSRRPHSSSLSAMNVHPDPFALTVGNSANEWAANIIVKCSHLNRNGKMSYFEESSIKLKQTESNDT